MKKLLTLLTAFCLLSTVSVSQSFAKPFAVADPQAADVYILEIWDDSMTTLIFSDNNVLPDSLGQYAFFYDLAPVGLTDASYQMRAKACNMWGCSQNWSPVYPFVKSVPGELVGTRVIPDRE